MRYDFPQDPRSSTKYYVSYSFQGWPQGNIFHLLKNIPDSSNIPYWVTPHNSVI